ncbi:hypothetical protein [Anaeromicropila populeti]|uniref:Uncharacterized protein n=1 Tax=Anaeromicropila populeti TaxID=37658 RepID=A0A1I6IB70_9FIRM|nr:hypothetical protein [Anaeromicropila populeti]SFR63926.1 hypothetical protein SAMN05661086_00643 [Anaeromicropila populeti]
MSDYEVQIQKIIDIENKYIILNPVSPVEGEFPPFIVEEEEKQFSLFSKETDARSKAEAFPIAKINHQELAAILMEYALHGGKEAVWYENSESCIFQSMDGVNACYRKLERPEFLKKNQIKIIKVFMDVLKEERKLYTMPQGGTLGGDILDNKFIPFKEENKIVFFAEEEQALSYYKQKGMPEDWNFASSYRQVVQVLLYCYDQGVRELILYYENEKIEIELDLLFWILQRMGRPEKYILLKPLP